MPLAFLGGPNVTKVEQWLIVIKRILKFMGVTNNDCHILVQEGAFVWWKWCPSLGTLIELHGKNFGIYSMPSTTTRQFVVLREKSILTWFRKRTCQ
ncbi:hypothetical protein CsatB_023066 [Cannabis sativa]